MQLHKLRELQLRAPPQPGRPSHLSAASGLVKVGTRLYVVADDELHLGVFDAEEATPGSLLRMFAGELPQPPEERKRYKPDLEALVRLPPFARCPHGALLALGSGSKPQRRRGVLLPLDAQGVNVAAARPLDLSGLLERMQAEIPALNVEGAVVLGDHLVLMHRGNKGATENCLLHIGLPGVLGSLDQGDEIGELPLLGVQRHDLGRHDAVPLSFTDGAALPDGRLVFAAVAEDTADSYRDGPCNAAAIGVISDGRVQCLQHLEVPYKIEGIHAELRGPHIELWLVTDADDPHVPALLLTGELGT